MRRAPTVPPAGSIRPTDPPGSLHDDVVAILRRYVSEIMLASTLKKSLEECRLGEGDLDVDNLPRVVEQMMVSLRLFCDPDKLPTLMLELAELCDRTTGSGSVRPSAGG